MLGGSRRDLQGHLDLKRYRRRSVFSTSAAVVRNYESATSGKSSWRIFQRLPGRRAFLGKDYHTDFYLDFDEEQARLGQIVVDLGGELQEVDLKVPPLRLREYLDLPHIRDIVSDGLFTFAIVVAEEEKAHAIRLALKQKPLKARVLVETSAELRKCPIQLGELGMKPNIVADYYGFSRG